jgi:hypothetical protein
MLTKANSDNFLIVLIMCFFERSDKRWRCRAVIIASTESWNRYSMNGVKKLPAIIDS